MIRHCAGLVGLVLCTSCGGPELLDPRTLAVAAHVSTGSPEQQGYIASVLELMERDACGAVESLRSRDVVLDPAAETQMLRAFTVARALCAAGIRGFPVTQDALGQLSFLASGVAPTISSTGVFAADDFREATTGLNAGDEVCEAEWVSAPMLVTSSVDRGLRLAASSGLRLSVSTTPGFPGCGSGRGPVQWATVRAGQILTVYAFGEPTGGAEARLDVADAASRGELIRYTGSSIYQPVQSVGNDVAVTQLAGTSCAGYMSESPSMVVDFGATPRSVEVSLSTAEPSVIVVLREDGTTHCSTAASYTYGSSLSLFDVRGVIQLWTGSVQAGAEYSGDLSIYAW